MISFRGDGGGGGRSLAGGAAIVLSETAAGGGWFMAFGGPAFKSDGAEATFESLFEPSLRLSDVRAFDFLRGTGPRLAPNPIPYEGFAQQLRKPANIMPPYTALVVSDAQLADLVNYLRRTFDGASDDAATPERAAAARAALKP